MGKPAFRIIQTHFAADNNVGDVAAKEEVRRQAETRLATVPTWHRSHTVRRRQLCHRGRRCARRHAAVLETYILDRRRGACRATEIEAGGCCRKCERWAHSYWAGMPDDNRCIGTVGTCVHTAHQNPPRFSLQVWEAGAQLLGPGSVDDRIVPLVGFRVPACFLPVLCRCGRWARSCWAWAGASSCSRPSRCERRCEQRIRISSNRTDPGATFC